MALTQNADVVYSFQDLVKLTVPPKVGDLVCIKTIVGGHQDLYRGKVLQVLATDQETLVEVFALDYGYQNVVSTHCLRVLTAAGREEDFQVHMLGVRVNLSSS